MGFDVKMDLERDISAQLTNEIRQLGYTYDDSIDLMAVATAFQMLQQRTIPAKRRSIICAPGLQVPAHLQTGFEAFCASVQSGGELRPFQSRLMKRESYRDLMLIDWGIQHFHLGTAREDDGFVNRCDPLLFAIVTDRAVHAIGFWGHGDWTDKEVIGIVHDHWPDLISAFRMEGVTGLSHNYSGDELKKLRKAQVNAAFEARPGAFYLPPGGGQMLSGDSMLASMRALHLQRSITQVERAARERVAQRGELKADVSLRGVLLGNRVDVRDEAGRLVAYIRL